MALNPAASLVLFSLMAAFAFGGYYGPQMEAFSRFFQVLSAQQRQQYFQLTFNPDLTRPQMNQQLDNFARQNGILDAYTAFNNSENQFNQLLQQSASGNLTGQALQVFNQIQTILNNNAQTRGAQCNQVRQVVNETDPVVMEFLPKCQMMSCKGIGNEDDDMD